ncbi:hypothetical protein HA520_20870 [Azotobacter chroococcum]|uniref:Uncharacterized protein n=1 Tax=Azotobacter chroococcum TaxID=353 RepID=A0AA43ZAI0_9GAMM|nr:hypothetical protein [Azotobacter chroococcum]NHN79695.1 hypothetical protein [Azotobacter chroococcum]
MHHKAIKKIADQLKEIASQVSAPDLGDGESFQMHHGVFYQLPNDAVIAFKELVAQILRNDDFHKRFSEKYVEEKLKEVFAGLLKDSAIDLESALMALVGEMDEYEKKCIVLLSVEGVRLSVCTILGKVKLAPCDESLFSFMQEKAQFVMESSIHGEGVKSVFRGC